MTDWMLVVDPAVQHWALRYLEWELAEISRRIALARTDLEAERALFEQLHARLAEVQAPLLQELAKRNAEITRLGGRVPRTELGVMHPQILEDQRQIERLKSAKHFYRLIVARLHHQGEYSAPDQLQAAREALKRGHVLRLLEIYQGLCGQSASDAVAPYKLWQSPAPASETEDPVTRQLRQLLFQRLLLDSIQQEHQRLNTDPLLGAYTSGDFETLLDESADQLHRLIRDREERIALLQMETLGLGESSHVHVTH